jgi:uncharacterized damage-inducible protein DinB
MKPTCTTHTKQPIFRHSPKDRIQMTETRDQLIVQPLAGYPQAIGAGLWRLQDERERTLEALKDLPHTALDWQAAGLQNSIGTLLYHIAAIEIDWLYSEVLQADWTPEMEALYCYPVRNDEGRLYPVMNVRLKDHLARLEKTRQYLLDGFKEITLEDYRTPRNLPDYDVTPEWVIHHLIHHEAEHRGEILTIRTLYKAANQVE